MASDWVGAAGAGVGATGAGVGSTGAGLTCVCVDGAASCTTGAGAVGGGAGGVWARAEPAQRPAARDSVMTADLHRFFDKAVEFDKKVILSGAIIIIPDLVKAKI